MSCWARSNDGFTVSGGTDTVDGGPGSTDSLFVNYAAATSGITGGVTGAGTIKGVKGSYSDGAGHAVTFNNISSSLIRLVTGSGNDNVDGARMGP